MNTRLCFALLFIIPNVAVHAADFKSEYGTEFAATSSQIVSLANAMPADKFDWRPGTGVRSVGEVEIIARNLDFEKTVRGKDSVVALLDRTLQAVNTSLATADMEKPVEMFGRMTTARAVYLRILAHANEHMGQSIAYARINGVVPPWSK